MRDAPPHARATARTPSLGGCPRRTATLAVAVASACLAALAISACTPRSTDAASTNPVKPTAPPADGEPMPPVVPPIAPPETSAPPATHTASALEISALSRVVRRADKPALIDVRVDAVDPSGGAARIGGSMRIVVRAPGAVPESLAFDFPMRTQREADQRFDPTLKQYVLRIEPSWTTQPASGSTIDLVATLSLASGESLEASGAIEW